MTMSWWQGLILGLVQGFTEFLPISSSGHLVLAERLVGFQSQGVFFEVMVHLATLLSVMVAYRHRIAELLRGLLAGRRSSLVYAGLLILASIPAAVIGLAAKDFFEQAFHTPVLLGVNFLVTAAILWSTKFAGVGQRPAAPVTAARSVLIGLGQALAILPAVSRSGTTISVALWTGISPTAAAEFSFLMAIIVIAGTGVLQLSDIPPGVDPFAPGMLWAFFAALLSGIVAIRLLVALLRSSRFHLFAPYCAALGGFCLVWFGLLGR
ncbi:MAG: undecaprenyl-diphosphate phosphatase [Gemmatimonadales bacterium]